MNEQTQSGAVDAQPGSSTARSPAPTPTSTTVSASTSATPRAATSARHIEIGHGVVVDDGATALQRAEALASLSSEAVLLLDGALRVVSASPNSARVLGRTVDDLRGRAFSACAPDDVGGRTHEALSSLLRCEGARGHWDFTLRVAAGPPRTFECRAVNLLTDPAVAAVVLNLRDIHDQRAAEAALRAANDQLARRLNELNLDRTVDAALSRVADLLQHCTTDAEAHDVVWGALPALLPGLSPALYFDSDDHLEFVRHRGVDVGGLATATPTEHTVDASTFLPAETCWALRTRRAHVSRRGGALRCDHVDDERDAACLPLVVGGRAFGLVVVTATEPATALPTIEELDRLAVRLSVALGNARVRRGPEDP
jgi:PAS domain S-box-containing protein